jgi:SLT domain-containing protein
MRSLIRSAVAGLMLAASIAPGAAFAQRHGKHAAMRVCKQNYKNAVRGAKYLRGPERRARMEQARLERRECESLIRRR